MGAAAINTVHTIVIDHVGDIYVGGSFQNFADIADADRIVIWDRSAAAWAAVVGGCNATIVTIAVDLDNNKYIGGQFTDWGDANGDYIVMWDGSALSSLSTGTNANVDGIAIANNNLVYLAGNFTTAGGTTVNYVASWNGTAFSPLGDGLSGGNADSIAILPDGIVLVGGTFTAAGGIATAGQVAKWNDSSWAHSDINAPGAPVVETFLATDIDPIVESAYSLWIGTDVSGTAYIAGSTSVSNRGTSSAYPTLIFERNGGTSAVIETIRNETTGKELLLDYSLLDGETLSIELIPTNKNIVSNFSGQRLDAILPNSDFGSFALQPGDNNITCFISEEGSPIVTVHVIWRTVYRSQD